jgi:CubicO group peptidase (beta-lactamase class C family)
MTFVFFVLINGIPVSTDAQADELKREIEKIIRYEQSIDFGVVPGVLIGVMDGERDYRFRFGDEIDPEGIYEMGSLTKPVVAWLVNKALVQCGANRFSKICMSLPDSLCSSGWEFVTYDHIIDHKAGLVRISPGIGEVQTDVQDPYKDYTLELLARDLKNMHPSPGRYSYSHVGYAATHWLFENVGGLEHFAAIQFHNAGMDHSGWNFPADMIQTGHGLDGRRQAPWNTNAFQTALGLKSTLTDMMTFIGILFDGYERNRAGQDPRSLKKELRAMSRMGAYKVVDGWFVIKAGKSLVYYHNGRTGGHHVSIAFTPQDRKGVVIISNGAMGSNDLSLLILRMINDAKPSSGIKSRSAAGQ